MDTLSAHIEELKTELQRTRARQRRRDLNMQIAEALLNVRPAQAVPYAEAAQRMATEDLRGIRVSSDQRRAAEITVARAQVALFFCFYTSEKSAQYLKTMPDAIATFEQHGDLLRVATARQKLAFYWLRNYDMPTARQLFEQDLVWLEEHEEARALIAAYNGLGQLALREGRHQDAEEMFRQGLHWAERYGEDRFLIAFQVGLGSVHEDQARFDKAREHYEAALALSKAESMQQQTASIHMGLAGLDTMEGRFAECIQHCSIAQDLYQHANDGFGQSAALEVASGAYMTIGDYTRALELLQRLQRVAEGIGSVLRMAGAHNLMATIYTKQKEHRKALENFQESHRLFELVGDHRGRCYTKANIAQSLVDLGRTTEAVAYVDAALEISRSYSFPDLEIEILPILCQAHGDDVSTAFVKTQIEHGLNLCAQLRHTRGTALLTKCLADAALKDHRTQQALEMYRSVYAQAMDIQDTELAASCAEKMSVTLEGIGDYRAALEWSGRFREAERRHINQEAERSVRNMTVLLETERLQSERNALAQQNALLQKESEFKQKELSAMALHLVHKNEMLEDVKRRAEQITKDYGRESRQLITDMLHQIDSALRDDTSWHSFQHQFQSVHTEFVHTLSERFPKLTPMELKICSLLKLQLSTKDIASALVLSPRTVEDHRNRLRKKFGLTKDENLSTFLSGLG